MLAALECVDHVAIDVEPTALTAIRSLKPDVYVKGGDYIVDQDAATDQEEAARSVEDDLVGSGTARQT